MIQNDDLEAAFNQRRDTYTHEGSHKFFAESQLKGDDEERKKRRNEYERDWAKCVKETGNKMLTFQIFVGGFMTFLGFFIHNNVTMWIGSGIAMVGCFGKCLTWGV